MKPRLAWLRACRPLRRSADLLVRPAIGCTHGSRRIGISALRSALLGGAAILAGSLAVWVCLAVDGVVEPPAGAAVVLNLDRQLATDTLLLRNGERRTGTLQLATVRLRTAEAEIAFPIAALAGLDLADSASGLVSLVTGHHDRLSGFLEAREFAFASTPAGTAEVVRCDAVLKVALRQRPLADSPPADAVLVQLRNGDFFVGEWLNARLRVEPTGAEMRWASGENTHLRFSPTPDAGGELGFRSGRPVAARPADPDLEFQLAAGPRLRIQSGRIEQLRPLGPLPAELQARIGVPGAGDTNRADAVRPDPAVVPAGDLVWIPPGEFVMGSPPEEKERDLDEGPLTRVVMPAGFWIGRHEVTQAEYETVVGSNPSRYAGDGALPVEKLTWAEAVDYCARLTGVERRAGRLPAEYAYRLPTEAEWEYACRAGTSGRFSHGDDPAAAGLPAYAWFGDNSDSTPHPVQTRKPNPWGLHDMHGNVLEWCLDSWRGSLPGGTVTNAVALPEGTLRVARGGSWLYPARAARSANRDSYGLLNRCSDLGFRVVLARTTDP
jgi:formylglycine-generating enzyme required for sulfatase activity